MDETNRTAQTVANDELTNVFTVLGPNLPAEAHRESGTTAPFHVHHFLCADARRGWAKQAPQQLLAADSQLDVEAQLMGDFLGDGRAPGSLLGEFHFLPCCQLD